MCLSDGALRLHFEGQTDGAWRCRSGDFRLLERARAAFLESHARTPLALVVIALH